MEPVGRPVGLAAYLGQNGSAEFQPHEALCRGVPAKDAILWEEPARGYAGDLGVLAAMAREVNFSLTDQPTRTQAALGLVTTHFANLSRDDTRDDTRDDNCTETVLELFLYLFHVLEVHGGLHQAEGMARDFIELTEAALSDAPRRQLRAAGYPSAIAHHLRETSIRI